MARQVSMYLIRTLISTISLNDIGAEFSGRNHATVLSSIRKVEDLLKTDRKMAATVRDITSNISQTQNGGGIYVNGTTTISNGIIGNCIATNGAGIYIANGNLIMSGGKITSNQASQNGGGIFAASTESDLTVTITSGSIIGNVASQNGGGVGINMKNGLAATVTVGLESCKGLNEAHSHPIIQDNTANENGGGFWLNGDKMIMNMYCGSIKENLAILEPGSANIYQTGGTATVHSGEIGEGVIVIGGEYSYVPANKEGINIIYDSFFINEFGVCNLL